MNPLAIQREENKAGKQEEALPWRKLLMPGYFLPEEGLDSPYALNQGTDHQGSLLKHVSTGV
jgi:hypothetical protein